MGWVALPRLVIIQINLKMALRVLVDNFDNPEIKMALQEHLYLKERIESAKNKDYPACSCKTT